MPHIQAWAIFRFGESWTMRLAWVLIIEGKARTASASRDGTAFSAVAPRERPWGSQPAQRNN